MPLTPERLRQLLSYNSATGEFFRKTGNHHRARPGDKAGYINNHGYLQIYVDGKRYFAHRLAWLWVHGYWPTELDHINRDRADNRISNLRVATRTQTRANSARANLSGFKGVSQTGRNWSAQIRHNGKRYCLGTFPTPELAHAAYCEAGRQLFGEFFCDGRGQL